MEMLPVGVRRDGSYYTQIEWASHTVDDPRLWVLNIIRDDNERDGGTWGANTFGPADVVLSFFGETQKVSRIRFFRNVGVSFSVLEELAKKVDIWYSDTDEPAKLRTAEDKIDSVEWKLIQRVDIEKAEGWQEVVFAEPVEAKYMRFTLVENDTAEIDWVEMNQIKIYP
ncbi:MAG: hypothetical protein IKK29_03150 [Christensenellaceae bacterium]|nr:hypothetical protein [Christensenellaceae bacterium]